MPSFDLSVAIPTLKASVEADLNNMIANTFKAAGKTTLGCPKVMINTMIDLRIETLSYRVGVTCRVAYRNVMSKEFIYTMMWEERVLEDPAMFQAYCRVIAPGMARLLGEQIVEVLELAPGPEWDYQTRFDVDTLYGIKTVRTP